MKARTVAGQTISAAKKKHKEAEFFKLTAENFSAEKLTELISSQGLFYGGSVIFLDRVTDGREEVLDVLIKKLKDLKSSPNFFVILEEKLNKKELEKFTALADKVEEFKKADKKLSKKEALALKGEKIDFFEFANALGARDKKLLWTLYQEVLAESVPGEEVHGIFFWQIKALLSALKSKNAAEAGLNPFVFTKSKSYLRNYGKTEALQEEKLKYLSNRLFHMYHKAHRGEEDLLVSLERFILEI